jgi:hypothetical protein
VGFDTGFRKVAIVGMLARGALAAGKGLASAGGKAAGLGVKALGGPLPAAMQAIDFKTQAQKNWNNVQGAYRG